ncbi:MAG: hypothetical protein E7472_04665 [Ruminococcaceae bacterium]|nr:hypothetical protein [Oscillospiraceae bacterium]
MTYDDIIAILAAFDGKTVDPSPDEDLFDDEFDTLHDDHLLPFGCRSYDEYADIDDDEMYALLGKD